MNILFVSTYISENILEYLEKTSTQKPLYCEYKFNKLFVEGLCANEHNIFVTSAISVSSSINKKIFWNIKSEKTDNMYINYSFFINLPVIRHICLLFSTFFYTLFWCLKHPKNSVVIIEPLYITISIASLLAIKMTRIKTVALVTDLPGFVVAAVKRCGILSKYITKLSMTYHNSFHAYILLTEQMNEIINRKQRPYIVMEGFVDIKMEKSHNTSSISNIRNIIYAGGLYEQYGIKKLIDAFIMVNGEDLQLSLYGKGAMSDELSKYEQLDSRIKYYGVVSNKDVVEAELSAFLLVNPRPTDEVFTKYSFPSKNMEYMASGTPVLTTMLPGMPVEYHQYVYIFDDESVNGFHDKLTNLSNLPKEELFNKGNKAREFVLQEKNNVKQAKRVIELLYSMETGLQ